MTPRHTLPINLNEFGFVTREKYTARDKTTLVRNRCGRDFFYYVLNYYLPEKFNPKICGPVDIEKKKLFGIPMPALLVWTCLPFFKIPKLFAKYGLAMEVNDVQIKSFASFLFRAIIFPRRMSANQAISVAKSAVDSGRASGIDISIALGGFIDHVMFVYGYDDDSLYVFDTYKLDGLEYIKTTPPHDERYIMKLPFSVIKNRWHRVNRIWVVKK